MVTGQASGGAVRGASVAAAGRGALIVLEGCDRAGKSTQAHRLCDWLSATGHPCDLLKFPNRQSPVTGGVINDYLCRKTQLPDAAVHLLFSANRWEAEPEMRRALEEGRTLVVDRYAYSGAAFTAAKGRAGLDLHWCQGPDRRLPRPDLVLFLDLPPEEAARRGGFGQERYEDQTFQVKVREYFLRLQDSDWRLVDASRSAEAVWEEVSALTAEAVTAAAEAPLRLLWDTPHSPPPPT